MFKGQIIESLGQEGHLLQHKCSTYARLDGSDNGSDAEQTFRANSKRTANSTDDPQGGYECGEEHVCK